MSLSLSQVSTTQPELQAAIDQVVFDAAILGVDVNVVLQRSINAVAGGSNQTDTTDVTR